MAAEQLHVRRATPLDHEAIRSFLAEDISTHRRRFGDFDVARLLETAALSIVAVAEAHAHEPAAPIAGFAAFSTVPVNPNGEEVSDSRFLEWYAGRTGAVDESDNCKVRAPSRKRLPCPLVRSGCSPRAALATPNLLLHLWAARRLGRRSGRRSWRQAMSLPRSGQLSPRCCAPSSQRCHLWTAPL